MNSALLKSSLRTGLRSILSYGLGTSLYLLLIIWVYPSVANMNMNELIQALPDNMRKLVGYDMGIGNLTDFLSGEFYGLLFIIILMVYSVMTANQLIVRLVDRGAMAYLLSTPVSRVRIAVSQAAVLVIGLMVITALTALGGILGANLLLEQNDLDMPAFLQINLVGFLLFAVVGAYSFVFSCWFNDEKKALGLSSIVTLLFFAMNLAGKMTDDLAWMKKLSVFSAFDPAGIGQGTVDVLPVSFGLAIAALALFSAAVFIFKKKNLPL